MKLQLWDTAGQEKYRSITANFFKSATGAIIVFALNNEKSFENVQHWIRQTRINVGENMCKIIIGNKCDLVENKINLKEIENFCEEFDIKFFQCSAKDNINVNESFYYIAKQIKEKHMPKDFEKKMIKQKFLNKTDDNNNDHSRNCCSK